MNRKLLGEGWEKGKASRSKPIKVETCFLTGPERPTWPKNNHEVTRQPHCLLKRLLRPRPRAMSVHYIVFKKQKKLK
jgi:hypothetical protein